MSNPTVKDLQVACFAAAQRLGSTSKTSELVRQAGVKLGDQAEELEDLKQIVRECAESSMARVALREFIRRRPNLFK